MAKQAEVTIKWFNNHPEKITSRRLEINQDGNISSVEVDAAALFSKVILRGSSAIIVKTFVKDSLGIEKASEEYAFVMDSLEGPEADTSFSHEIDPSTITDITE